MPTLVTGKPELDEALRPIVEHFKGGKGITIPLLAAVQEKLGYLSPEALDFLSKELDIPAAEMFGVATFYAMFRLQPQGKHVVRLCRGTACHVQGSLRVGEMLQRHLNVKEGETTGDGLFTLQFVACLGCCSLAPVMMVDDEVHGRLTPEKAVEILESYRKAE
jgi:NADH-quinone oxidoreductase subunit E